MSYGHIKKWRSHVNAVKQSRILWQNALFCQETLHKKHENMQNHNSACTIYLRHVCKWPIFITIHFFTILPLQWLIFLQPFSPCRYLSIYVSISPISPTIYILSPSFPSLFTISFPCIIIFFPNVVFRNWNWNFRSFHGVIHLGAIQHKKFALKMCFSFSTTLRF